MKFFATTPIGLEFVALEELNELVTECVVPFEDEVRALWPCNWQFTNKDKKLLRRIRRGLEPESAVSEYPIDVGEVVSRLKPNAMPGILPFVADESDVLKLRNDRMKSCKVMFAHLADADMPTDRESAHKVLNTDLMQAVAENWWPAVRFWRAWNDKMAEDPEDDQLTFRGTTHKLKAYSSDNCDDYYDFSSVEAAGWLGYGVGKTFPNLSVDLSNPHLHVVAFFYKARVTVGLALSEPEKTNVRNRAEFGKTSLQVQEAFCIAKLAGMSPGDIVLDCFCGTGIIPIEAAQLHEGSVFGLCSDAVQDEVCTKSAANIAFSGTVGHVDAIVADASRLPWRDGSISRILSDMPWGRRSGSFLDHVVMYPRFLKDAARVLRPDGALYLLTLEKGIMRTYLRCEGSHFDIVKVLHVNNGYDVALFHLKPRPLQRDQPATTARDSDGSGAETAATTI